MRPLFSPELPGHTASQSFHDEYLGTDAPRGFVLFFRLNQDRIIPGATRYHAGRGRFLRVGLRHSSGCKHHQRRLLQCRLRECEPHAVLAPADHA